MQPADQVPDDRDDERGEKRSVGRAGDQRRPDVGAGGARIAEQQALQGVRGDGPGSGRGDDQRREQPRPRPVIGEQPRGVADQAVDQRRPTELVVGNEVQGQPGEEAGDRPGQRPLREREGDDQDDQQETST